MNPILVPLALLAATVLCVAIAVRVTRNSGESELNGWSRFFLVGLRLVIGWHFLVEGLEKLHTPTWSSEAYLRESTGPLAPRFRALAGDRLVDKLTVGADKSFPPELELEWRTYLDAFSDHYGLNDEHRKAAKAVFDQAKSRTLTWLTATKQPVMVSASQPPDYVIELTVPERLQRHEMLEANVAAIEADLPDYGSQLFTKHRNAKSELSKWRGALKKDLDQQFLAFKKDLREGVLLPVLQELLPEKHHAKLTPAIYRDNRAALGASTFGLLNSPVGVAPLLAASALVPGRPKEIASIPGRGKENEWIYSVQSVHHQILLEQTSNRELELSPQAERIFLDAFDRKQGEQSSDELLPTPPRRPFTAWTMLDWSDAVVKYGLVAVGGCLLIGFLTRTACLVGAMFLLMFFLAMPPLPFWPESPRAEGHYLYINKNIIEMFALLALATLRTGRWVGVDGLLQVFRPARWRTEPASGNVK